jgi:phosphohistidine phosphatase
MSRQLIILRHAKSDWGHDTLADFDRPLTNRGKKDAPRMGVWLREQGLIPDYVLSSPAKRAQQTAHKVCKELGIAEAAINWEPGIYEASRARLCQLLAGCPAQAQRVLLVGHNPGLEELLVYLCRSVPISADGKLLPTAAVGHLAMPADWTQLEPGTATLITITRPRSLA